MQRTEPEKLRISHKLTMVLMVVCTLCGGGLYVFGLVAPVLKVSLNFLQVQIALMFALIYSFNLALIPLTRLAKKIGTTWTIISACAVTGLIWTLITLSVAHVIPTSGWAFVVYFCLTGVTQGAIFVCLLTWIAENIPKHQEVMSLLVNCAYAVGGTVFAVLQMWVLGDLVSFMTMLTVCFSCPALLFLVATFIHKNMMKRSTEEETPLTINVVAKHDGDNQDTAALAADAEAKNEIDTIPLVTKKEVKEVELSTLELLKFERKQPVFVLAFVQFMLSQSVPSAIQSNLGNIVQSLRLDDALIPKLEIFFSCMQSAGRMFSIFFMLHNPPFNVTVIGVLPFVLQIVACASFFQSDAELAVWMLVGFGSLGYGVGWSCASGMIFCLPKGKSQYTEVYAFATFGIGVAAPLLGIVVGRLYDIRVPAGQLLCYGKDCFAYGIACMTALAVVGLVVAVVGWLLHLRNASNAKRSAYEVIA
eukprot:TRINITY_DN7956_c0_g1_i1.p1 TRINITY_DN7956_c0_g1~~TRINITY_DN7956_c0_g1_i1.p1  ORF type:complete len:476 (-),score=96.57 TRINITY_DN7956_c0_g1_i1:1069-2496(-)